MNNTNTLCSSDDAIAQSEVAEQLEYRSPVETQFAAEVQSGASDNPKAVRRIIDGYFSTWFPARNSDDAAVNAASVETQLADNASLLAQVQKLEPALKDALGDASRCFNVRWLD